MKLNYRDFLKKRFTTVFLILGLYTSFANAEDISVRLANTDTSNLQIEQSQLKVVVDYPTPNVSGICGIDIVADSYFRQHSIEKLLDQVNILDFFGKDSARYTVISNTRIRIYLNDSFVDGTILITKDGRTLKEAIASTLGASRKVVLMPKSCI